MATSESSGLLNACRLRHEETTRENYAADLQRSLTAELSTPNSAAQFFQSTFPTNGIREICRRIFHRLVHGDASHEPSVYRLGSSFGGGKTHTLITLAGAAKHPSLIQQEVTPVPSDFAPGPRQCVRLVTFVGENTDVEQGARLESTGIVRAKSLIGHMAWQLGGEYALNQFRRYDENLSSPGSEDIAHLLGTQPCLILIDELVQWLARLDTPRFREKLPEVRTLISALARAVECCPHAVMVVTVPDAASDAYRRQTQQVLDILDELDSILARNAYQTTPSSPPDLPNILRRRLFLHVDSTACEQVSKTYAELCRRSSALIAPLPQDISAQQWFAENYPFHPDTLRIITDRIAGNDNFQKTRGILRLLGKTIRFLQRSEHDECTLLLHPYHIDPKDRDIHAELTTRINKEEYIPAIKSDITDPDSTANRIDRTRAMHPAHRLTRTVLLASLAPIDSAQGLTKQELVRATITPYDEDPSVVENAIDEFRHSALYVNDDPHVPQIHFTTVANIRRMLLERSHALTSAEVNQRIRQAIENCFVMPNQKSRSHLEATIFPSGSDIPDNPDSIGLGIINPEWFTQEQDGLLHALVNFYRNSPLAGGQSPRQYKNNLCILVADADDRGDMRRHAQRSLAARHIRDNPPDNLQPHQQEILDTELTGADRDLAVAIQKLYVHLYYPSTEYPIAPDALMQHVTISPEVAAERPGDGQHAVIHTLTSRRKLVTPQNADLDPESFWQQRLIRREGKIRLSSLKAEFAREPGNYMLLNGMVFDALLRKALDRKAFVIRTGAGQLITHGGELVRTDDPEAVLYAYDSLCSDCRQLKDECRCNAPELRLCPHCGRPSHPGACRIDPPPSFAIPKFESGLDPQPLNVLVKNLRDHMEQHRVAVVDIEEIVVRGDSADFINYMVSLLGQHPKAAVSYRLQRGDDINFAIFSLNISEWATGLSRVVPALERIKGVRILDAAVTISGDANTAAQLDGILNGLPPNRTAGMEVTFRQKPTA